MNAIEYPLDIKTLYLTWQPKGNQVRYFVAEIKKVSENDFQFEYHLDSIDYKEATEAGFRGVPSFRTENRFHNGNVLDLFLKRLPPKSRKDFSKYLEYYGISKNLEIDDFTLLAHTGVQLPSDGLVLIPKLDEAQLPFDYIMEVAGTRHHLSNSELELIPIGASVEFVPEQYNCHDGDAISINYESKKIGYVNKMLCGAIGKLLTTNNVSGHVFRKSGTEDRPLIYLLIRVD
ncbi:MAG: hypothetical protein ACI9B7_000969 [Oleispira sp.]|jgi:hypothetical protein